jgi:hypothetical protein
MTSVESKRYSRDPGRLDMTLVHELVDKFVI